MIYQSDIDAFYGLLNGWGWTLQLGGPVPGRGLFNNMIAAACWTKKMVWVSDATVVGPRVGTLSVLAHETGHVVTGLHSRWLLAADRLALGLRLDDDIAVVMRDEISADVEGERVLRSLGIQCKHFWELRESNIVNYAMRLGTDPGFWVSPLRREELFAS